MGTVRFGNDHVAAILGFGDLQWGNILITRVYFVEGLGHNLFSVGQFCDSDLEVEFRRNACFVKNLEGVDLLKGDRSTNLYTINLHEMASASPICLMARASVFSFSLFLSLKFFLIFIYLLSWISYDHVCDGNDNPYIDEHDTKIQATVRIDKLKRFQHHLKEGNALTILRYSLGKMCIQNEYWGTKLYLFYGNKAIYEDEYKEVEEFRQRLFANQPSEQSKNTATKISTASKNSTKDTFVNKHPIRNIAELLDVEQGVQSVIVGNVIAIQEDEGWWYLACRGCRGKDETGTISLSLFNDEVQAMVGRSAYQLCEKYAKSESNGSIPTEITNLVDTTMDENDPANARKRRKEFMSNRKRASSKDKRSNPSVSSDAFLACRVSQMQQQDTNVVTTPLPFGLNRSLTLRNSIEYYDHGDPTFVCKECQALLWEAEAKRGNPNPDETGTMSLSLFNDEVLAMSESNGSIPTEITNLIGNKYAFKVAIDDYNVKNLLPVFTVLRFSNDQEIINFILACATPIKSQTDENTTPNEKQKINKRPAEGEPRKRLYFHRAKQSKLRCDTYLNIRSSIAAGNTDLTVPGKPIVLSSSFTGGPRYLSACEAAWRLFGFEVQYRTPSVERLCFTCQASNKFSKELTYAEFPTKYVWNAPKRFWTLRKQKSIGRIHNAPVSTGDAFYCRMLLNSAKGCRMHDEIKKMNGVVYPTYK
nr:hypothetical protein [Tanacetum cinerariifolium]